MSQSLHDLLKKNIKKMISGIGTNEKSNIYSLIIEEIEKIIINLVLQETQYNYFRAAKILGISRSTLYRKIETLGIRKL